MSFCITRQVNMSLESISFSHAIFWPIAAVLAWDWVLNSSQDHNPHPHAHSAAVRTACYSLVLSSANFLLRQVGQMAKQMSCSTAFAQPTGLQSRQICRIRSAAIPSRRRQAAQCRALGDEVPAAFRPSTPTTVSSDSQQDESAQSGASTAAQQTTPDTPENRKRAAELLLGCRTVLKELSGLDFPPSEVLLYMAASTKAPRGFAPALLPRARDAIQRLVKAEAAAELVVPTDVEGLQLAQAMLSDLWRWRRKGGGMDYVEEESRPHKSALEELQNMKPADIDRVQSSLLDSLPISDKEKAEMSGSVQQAVVGGIQGAVWGSLVLCLLFLIVFNFLRSN